MKIAVTGPDGFIAWHTRAAIYANTREDTIRIGRAEFDDDDAMDAALTKADAVIHLAGVNRASNDEITNGNLLLARKLVAGLERAGSAIPIVYGNSIHSDGESIFGEAKREAGEILNSWGNAADAPVIDVVLPNVFGEHGRPFYNSVVSTFCHQLAHGQSPTVETDREIPLLHVQHVASQLLCAAHSKITQQLRPEGTPTSVTALLRQLTAISEGYKTADLPDLSNPFTRDLFNTYRSYTFPQDWPIHPPTRGDQRGDLHEAVRAEGGEAQVFFSTTRPGFTRGQHFHLRKVERFVVLRGTGVIRLRRLFGREVVEFPVSGEAPAILDMPTMWAHSITNTGDEDLVTLFYADEVFDADSPDTFPEDV